MVSTRRGLSDVTGAVLSTAVALRPPVENAVSSTINYGQKLAAGDFSANAIFFVITDGMDNASKFRPRSVKDALARAVSSEALESVVSLLIGVNVREQGVSRYLQQFYKDAGFTQYVEIEKADTKTLARLAEFVSQSISAQSQALGSGGASSSLVF